MGKLSHLYKIAIASTLTKSNFNVEETILDRRFLIMPLLPEGTKYVSMEKMLVEGMSMDFLLTFEHPFFPDGSKIDIELKHAVWETGDPSGLIGQGSYVTGISYTGPDGKPIA